MTDFVKLVEDAELLACEAAERATSVLLEPKPGNFGVAPDVAASVAAVVVADPPVATGKAERDTAGASEVGLAYFVAAVAEATGEACIALTATFAAEDLLEEVCVDAVINSSKRDASLLQAATEAVKTNRADALESARKRRA